MSSLTIDTRFISHSSGNNVRMVKTVNGSVHLSISCTNSIQEKCSGTVQEMSRSCLGMVQKHVLDEFILKKCRAVMEISWTVPGELPWTFPEQFPNAFPGRN